MQIVQIIDLFLRLAVQQQIGLEMPALEESEEARAGRKRQSPRGPSRRNPKFGWNIEPRSANLLRGVGQASCRV